MMGFRSTGAATLAALFLAGCGSTVKLEETPVESRTPTAVSAKALADAAEARRSGSAAATTPQSQVATINLPPAAGSGAAVSSGVGPSANAGANAALGRVVYFDFDSFAVADNFRSVIEGHAKALAAARSKRVVIEGHSDERGGREYNLALGQKRAEAVARSLSLLGAAEAQVEAVSFGKERPASEGHDEAAWAQNRRAEIKDR